VPLRATLLQWIWSEETDVSGRIYPLHVEKNRDTKKAKKKRNVWLISTPRVQIALPQWVSRTFGSRDRYENAPSPNPTFLEHIGSKRPAFSKRPGPTMLFRPPNNWKTILVSD
jgi:hypothetical protein